MARDLIIYTPMYVTFFWAVVLLSSRRKDNRARFFLGVFMGTSFLVYLSHSFFFNRDILACQYFEPVYIFASLSMAPLYYWYIKLLTVETGIRLYNLRLLIPAFLFGFATVVFFYLMDEAQRLDYLNILFHSDPFNSPAKVLVQLQKWNYILSRLVFSAQILFFLMHGRRLVFRYNKQIANFYSNIESKTIDWVKFLLYTFLIASTFALVFNAFGRSTFSESLFLLLIPSAVFSVLFFLIGMLGYKQNHTVVDLVRDEANHPGNFSKIMDAGQLGERLTELFETRKIYRQPELKITQVSQVLGTNRSYISSLINTRFSVSFNDFVNRFRVEEAKELLTENSMKNDSLDSIAEAVGFGSVGTFIRVFRSFEGKTPGKYRRDTVETGD